MDFRAERAFGSRRRVGLRRSRHQAERSIHSTPVAVNTLAPTYCINFSFQRNIVGTLRVYINPTSARFIASKQFFSPLFGGRLEGFGAVKKTVPPPENFIEHKM
jgi:hypothetical protein